MLLPRELRSPAPKTVTIGVRATALIVIAIEMVVTGTEAENEIGIEDIVTGAETR